MKGQETMPVGVVLARRKTGHKWQDHAWRAIEVIPGAPEVTEWRLLRQDAIEATYLAATLPLELYPGETPGYRQNLSQRKPMVYVVLRRDDGDADRPVRPFRATVCPVEAQDYLDGDDIVETVSMPPAVAAWLQDFVKRHHVEQVFEKRGRRERDARRDREGRGDG